jgi:CubicO group peptidase (beta-lactamase class C family)
VAVAMQNELRWSNGYGLADIENFVPAKAHTVYRLGSISKPITAVAVMQLVERGKLDLDAPVQKYVPSFPAKPWPVTTRHLLSHLSGIRHYRNEAEVNSTRHYTDMLEPLRIFQDDPLLFEPGARFSYTTYGYNLLGAVAESASGLRFADYLRENVFRPAGMDKIGADDHFRIIPNRARGYRKSPAGEIQNCNLADTSNKIPGGGMSSTVEDLVKFGLAVQTHVLLKKDTVEQMFTRQKTTAGQAVDYGLGFAIREFEDKRSAGHGGSQQGVNTFLHMLPADGVAVAVMLNLEGGRPIEVADRITRILIR